MTSVSAIPDSDATAGMTIYLTASPGIGGQARQRAADFVVEEVYKDHAVLEGRYQLVKVTKTNTETHHLIRDLSRRFGISQKRISWAGTKDKRAVTTQRMSLDSICLEAPLTLGNAVVEPIGRSDRRISLGDLEGNNFFITIRGVEGALGEVARAVASVVGEIHNARGVPNFFGIQRFGAIRLVNQLVGRALVDGDVERAVMTYVGKPFLNEPEDVKEVRQLVLDARDFKEALRRMPVSMRYERAMLNHLAKYPSDFDGALGALSLNLQKLFVHSFQSYLFNTMVSKRIGRGIPLNVGFDGDRVWVSGRERIRTVVPKNREEVNQSLAAGNASIQMPVPGYDTEVSDGIIGEIERDVLSSEGVDLDDFKIESCPRLASKGVLRNILLPVDVQFSVMPDELTEDRAKVAMRFFLPKGGYATTVLREVMKTTVLQCAQE